MLVSKSIPPHQRGGGRNIPISIGMTSDSTSIILDPSVDGTNSSYVPADATWTVTFPDYTVSGIVSCDSPNGGTFASAHPEYNNQITQGYHDGGLNCWCRMTSPVRSAWVFSDHDNVADDCTRLCAYRCARNIKENTYINFRRAMFNSAGNW